MSTDAANSQNAIAIQADFVSGYEAQNGASLISRLFAFPAIPCTIETATNDTLEVTDAGWLATLSEDINLFVFPGIKSQPTDVKIPRAVFVPVGYALAFLLLAVAASVAGGLMKGGVALLQPDIHHVLTRLANMLPSKSSDTSQAGVNQ